MKRCPQCNRIETDEALKFCRVDGATLVSESANLGDEAGTAKPGASSASAEIETSILPHKTDSDMSRATGPTTALPPQMPASTGALNKPKSRKAIVIAVIAAVLIVAVTGTAIRLYFSSSNSASVESIAVLPFDNKSNDSDSDYLADGLAESLIYRLSQLPNLKVSPTSSVMRYKGKETDVIKIGNELGVHAVMSGRMVQRGDNLTISVELVDVRKNQLLWGEQYERKMSELLETQRTIATEITNKLQLKLSGADAKGLTKRYTNNDEAYQLYLKARYHFAKRTKDDMLKSVEYFQQAIKLDPNYALAHAGVADSYNGMTAYPYLSPKEAIPQAKAAAKRALEIDPSLAEAHTALANSLACFDWNWEEAEREFKRAIDLNPNDSGTHWRYGMFYLMVLGRADESIAEGKRAVELEPLNLNHGANLSGLYFHARQNDKAYNEAKQVFELDPNFIVGRWALSQSSIMKGMYAEVIALNEESLQREPTNQVFLRFAGLAYAKAGRRQEAEAIINRYRDIARTQYVMSYHVAVIYAALGEKDKAFAELEKAYQEHDYLLPRIKVEPFLDPLRDDPRFKDLMQRLNLPQ
jgi:TolB-like protein/Flp pilus assembly protein TadD